MAPVVLPIPSVGQPTWTDTAKRAGGVMYGGEGAEEVEHAANQSLAEDL